jgi:hypothetical protein
MQFGVGILGAGWKVEDVIARLLVSDAPVRRNFHRHASCYAAKLAAETVRAEPPTRADLSDDALLIRFASCALPVRRSEVHMVREAFIAEHSLRRVAA